MTRNWNLPPGASLADLGGARDMAEAMEAFFERLDRRAEERRDDAALRHAERREEDKHESQQP